MADIDPLRARFAATRSPLELGDWSLVRARAGRASRRRRARRALSLAVAALGVVLVLPSPGIGQRLLDVIAGRPARPALQQYLARFSSSPALGQIDVARARELVTAASVRGPVTLFVAPSTAAGDCLGLFAGWLRDPGVGCGYLPGAPRSLGATLVSRGDPHVLTIVGTAPAGARRVRLATPRGRSSVPVVDGYFLFALDPTAFARTPSIELVALGSGGATVARAPVDLAAFYDPRCDQHTPSHVERAIVASDGSRLELRSAETVDQRCYWLQTSGGEVVGGIWIEPLRAAPYDPAREPALIPRPFTLPAGGHGIFGRAAIVASGAVVRFQDGRRIRIPLVDGYLLVSLPPAQLVAGHRPDAIELIGPAGARRARVALGRGFLPGYP